MGLSPRASAVKAGRAAAGEGAGLASRRVALDLLTAVLRRGRPLDEALAAHAGIDRLHRRDRAFARMLVATTLRRLGEIDRTIAGCLDRPLAARAAVVQDILRLGVCQIRYLETGAHAAVDTAVVLAESQRGAAFKGLVNAVLRRIAREAGEPSEAAPVVRLNTPDWLWESWATAYGKDRATAIAAAHLCEPPLDVSVKADPAGWAERLGAEMLPTGTLRRPSGGVVEELPGYREGGWWVQDAAAALPARLLGDLGGKQVIDLCAAPGGKTAQLAAAGARVTAVERSPARTERLRQNLSRLGLEAEIVTADALEWRPAAPAAAVLLDAPCTATGTIRRHPDIAWIKRPGDPAVTVALQTDLLAAAAAMVSVGGLLVYAVCSLQPEECEGIVRPFLENSGAFERVPIEAREVSGLAALLTTDGDLRSLPCHLAHRGGLDGFYAARLRRVG